MEIVVVGRLSFWQSVKGFRRDLQCTCKWGMLEHIGSPEGNFLLPLHERGRLLSSDCQWVCLPYDLAGTVHRTEGLLVQIKESVTSPIAMFRHERDRISRCWPRS